MKDKNHKQQSDNNPLKTIEGLGEAYRRLAPYLNIGYVWAASVIAFTLLGIYLDKRFSTKPWLTLVGALLGIVTGFYNFIKTVTRQEK